MDSEETRPLITKRCSDCGESFETTKKLQRLCKTCKEEHEKQRRERQQAKRDARVAAGKCGYISTCNNPVVPGHKACQEHLDYVRGRNQARKEELSNIKQTREVMKRCEFQKLYDPKQEAVNISEQEGYHRVTPAPVDKLKEMQRMFKRLEDVQAELKITSDKLVQLTHERETLLGKISERMK